MGRTTAVLSQGSENSQISIALTPHSMRTSDSTCQSRHAPQYPLYPYATSPSNNQPHSYSAPSALLSNPLQYHSIAEHRAMCNFPLHDLLHYTCFLTYRTEGTKPTTEKFLRKWCGSNSITTSFGGCNYCAGWSGTHSSGEELLVLPRLYCNPLSPNFRDHMVRALSGFFFE